MKNVECARFCNDAKLPTKPHGSTSHRTWIATPWHRHYKFRKSGRGSLSDQLTPRLNHQVPKGKRIQTSCLSRPSTDDALTTVRPAARRKPEIAPTAREAARRKDGNQPHRPQASRPGTNHPVTIASPTVTSSSPTILDSAPFPGGKGKKKQPKINNQQRTSKKARARKKDDNQGKGKSDRTQAKDGTARRDPPPSIPQSTQQPDQTRPGHPIPSHPIPSRKARPVHDMTIMM